MKSTFLRLIVTIFAVALLLCGVKVGSLSKIPTDAATKKPLPVTEAPLLTVPAEMEKLARALEGTWQVSEKLEPSNSLPNGGTGRGRVIYRQTAGGMALIEEYRSTGPAGEYQGAALFWWDEPARVYRAPWCDNAAGCTGSAGVGHWEGNDLVWMDEAESGGQKSTIREIYTDITPASMTQIIEAGPSGGKLKRSITIHSTKLTR